jgi:23S rRNA (cytosine1962-C5)-methyltransferase
MVSARLVLNKGVRHRILAGHPWVFASEVDRIEGHADDGGTVEVRSSKGEFLGSAIYNSRSQIVARRYSKELTPLDERLLGLRLDAALAYRESLAQTIPGMARRIVWSESDQLPGLIVDRYDDVAVIQTLTMAMSQREAIIADLVLKKTGCRVVLTRNDAPVRQLEGLPLERNVLHGTYEAPTRVKIAGINYALDLWSGQKTGFYLDQAENYAAVAACARGRRVLDCFTNQGAFALSACKAGAVSCRAVD